MFGFFKRIFGIRAAQAQPQAARAFTDMEAMCRIRNLLNDRRFKFRKLGTIAKAIGRELGSTSQLLNSMSDVRPARNNYRIIEPADTLYRFISR